MRTESSWTNWNLYVLSRVYLLPTITIPVLSRASLKASLSLTTSCLERIRGIIVSVASLSDSLTWAVTELLSTSLPCLTVTAVHWCEAQYTTGWRSQNLTHSSEQGIPVSKNSDFLSVTSCHSVSDQLLRLTNFEELPMTAVRWKSLCTWHKD